MHEKYISRLSSVYFNISVIGGWSNTKSAIRRVKQGDNLVEVSTPKLLKKGADRSFIIKWDEETLSVTQAGEDTPFMTYTDKDPLNVRYVGFTTGWGSGGKWTFLNLNPKATGTRGIGKHE